jgi:hypothetical protein
MKLTIAEQNDRITVLETTMTFVKDQLVVMRRESTERDAAIFSKLERLQDGVAHLEGKLS